MKKSVCIVASTLPIGFLSKRAADLSIGTVVTTSSNLAKSYTHLRAKIGPNLKIIDTPIGLIGQSLYFFGLLLTCKLLKRRVIFFHECCMPVFDLLIHLIRPTGDFFPQVTMLGSVPMAWEEAPKSKIMTLLSLTGLSRLFTVYYSPPVGGLDAEYSLSIKIYPSSITSHHVYYAGERDQSEMANTTVARRILLLVGKAKSSDDEQRSVFAEIVRLASRYDLKCDVKDHPNPKFRLDFTDQAIESLNPEIPSELLDSDYAFVIGASSTGLLRYGDRALSIVDMLKSMLGDELKLVKAHFDKTMPQHKIRYLHDLDHLAEIFEEKNK